MQYNLLSNYTRTAFRKKKRIQIPLLAAILELRKLIFNFIFAKPFAIVHVAATKWKYTRTFINIRASV
jgi:hypothetical protein